MQNINQFTNIASDMVREANSAVLPESGRTVSEFWNHDDNSVPEDGPYEPTGYDKIDKLVLAMKPKIRYGGDNASNLVEMPPLFDTMRNSEWVKPFMLDSLHFIDLPHKASFVDADKYASVLAHELVHWKAIRTKSEPLSGMKNPESEMQAGNRMPVDYSVDEITAEIGSTLIMKWAGAPVPDEVPLRVKAMASHIPALVRDTLTDFAAKRAVRLFVDMLDSTGLGES